MTVAAGGGGFPMPADRLTRCTGEQREMLTLASRGGELGVLRVREHPLSAQAPPHRQKHPLKIKENFVKYLVILRSNKTMVI